MSRRCRNCGNWAQTDGVWGTCAYASTYKDDSDKIANAVYVRIGNEHQATLETKYTFGCSVWKSLHPTSEARP